MLRIFAAPEPESRPPRPTDMTSTQRRPVAMATIVMMLLTAGLVALVVSATTPSPGRVLSSAVAHHATVPSPIRSHSHGSPALDVAVLGGSLLLGLVGAAFVQRRPTSDRLSTQVIGRPPARGPPYSA